MRITPHHLVIGLTAAALLVACSSRRPPSRTAKLLENQSGDVDMYEELTGIDDNTSVKIEPEEKPEQASAPTDSGAATNEDMVGGSQGVFLGRLLLDGKETKGVFSVKAATTSGEVVQENLSTGSDVKLDPGMYDFVFQTGEVAGNPEFTLRDVEIVAGRRIKRDVKMPVGKITLITGGKCVKRPIKIRITGATDWMKGKFYTCQQLTLLAGTYDAVMGQGRRTTPISGIQVYDGGIRDVLIRPN